MKKGKRISGISSQLVLLSPASYVGAGDLQWALGALE
jgi:hypothetical protein